MPVYGPGFDAECTGKPGTFVLLNIWAAECTNVEPPPFFGADEAHLRSCVQAVIFADPPDVMSVPEDGRGDCRCSSSAGASGGTVRALACRA